MNKKQIMKYLKENQAIHKTNEEELRRKAGKEKDPEAWDQSRITLGYMLAYEDFILMLEELK